MTILTSLSAVLAIFILILASFAHGQAEWGSPNSTISYQTGTLVPVLILTSTSQPVTVVQACGANSVIQDISTNVFAYFQLPEAYIGPCIYSLQGSSILQPLTINTVESSKVITFISPMTTDPITEYSAGSIITFKYVVGPPDSLSRPGQFSCSNLTLSPVSFVATQNTTVPINIPYTFYGNYCSFVFTGLIEPVQVANTAVISVIPLTQTLVFLKVPETIQMEEPFIVKIAATGTPPLSTIANLGLFCDGGSSPAFEWYNVTLDQSVPLILPEMSIPAGIGCYLKALSTVPNLIDSQSSPVLIKLNIMSPFGGNLDELTDQEVAIFLTTVIGNPQSWYVDKWKLLCSPYCLSYL